jgi:hypothetical protein
MPTAFVATFTGGDVLNYPADPPIQCCGFVGVQDQASTLLTGDLNGTSVDLAFVGMGIGFDAGLLIYSGTVTSSLTQRGFNLNNCDHPDDPVWQNCTNSAPIQVTLKFSCTLNGDGTVRVVLAWVGVSFQRCLDGYWWLLAGWATSSAITLASCTDWNFTSDSQSPRGCPLPFTLAFAGSF